MHVVYQAAKVAAFRVADSKSGHRFVLNYRIGSRISTIHRPIFDRKSVPRYNSRDKQHVSTQITWGGANNLPGQT